MKHSSNLQKRDRSNVVRATILTVFVLTSASMTVGFDSASSNDTDARQRITSVLSKFHARAGFPGATIGYSLASGSSGSVSVGFADESTRTPMRGDHLMMAGSTGKTFFAALALQLVDQGTLHLDKKISTWFAKDPWFERIPNARDITLRMLLNHTSGIPRYVMLPAFVQAMQKNPGRTWKPAEILEFVLDHKAAFPAGQGWSYADTNFILAAMIIERATGSPCYEQIRNTILRRNNLLGVVPTISRDATGFANGYVDAEHNLFHLKNRPVIRDKQFVFNPQFEWAGGGFATTPADLARWARILYIGDVLGAAMKAEMLTTVKANLGPDSRYGLGLMQRPSKHGIVFGHSGYFPGYLTEMAYYADLDLSIAIQVNTTKMSKKLNPTTLKAVLDQCAADVATRQ